MPSPSAADDNLLAICDAPSLPPRAFYWQPPPLDGSIMEIRQSLGASASFLKPLAGTSISFLKLKCVMTFGLCKDCYYYLIIRSGVKTLFVAICKVGIFCSLLRLRRILWMFLIGFARLAWFSWFEFRFGFEFYEIMVTVRDAEFIPFGLIGSMFIELMFFLVRLDGLNMFVTFYLKELPARPLVFCFPLPLDISAYLGEPPPWLALKPTKSFTD